MSELTLEQGDLVHYPQAPIALPTPDDLRFLQSQRLHQAREIVFEPNRDRLAGHLLESSPQAERLHRLLAEANQRAGAWLARAYPRYAAVARPVRTSFHPAEEATRTLRVTARNDLLHVDAFHHSRGERLLRLFINLNPTDPRVWTTSLPLAKIFADHAHRCGMTDPTPLRWAQRLSQGVLQLFTPKPDLTSFDQFMLDFARYLKHNDEFQDKSPRKVWHFAPGAAWTAFTDGLVHAELRGRWVLDHLFLIPQDLLVCPEVSPLRLFEQRRAAVRAA